jgi:hypothetical protein
MATLKSKDGAVGLFETVAQWSVGDGKPKESKTGTFSGPADAGSMEAYLKTLDGEGRTGFFTAWLYGADLKKKAQLRPAAAVDSPWIARDDININLATGERINKKTNEKLSALAIEKCIAAVNAGMDGAASLGTEPQSAFVVARRMLLESKVAADASGKLVVARK